MLLHFLPAERRSLIRDILARKIRCMSRKDRSERATRLRRDRLRLLKRKKGNRCADCGVAYPPECLQFAHRDQKEKHPWFRLKGSGRNSFSNFCNSNPAWVVQAEIEKCDLKCANCHAIETEAGGHAGFRGASIGSSKKSIHIQLDLFREVRAPWKKS